MIEITKQLMRPDGGKIAANSILIVSHLLNPDKTINYRLRHYISQSAIDQGKKPIPEASNLSYKQKKVCTNQEWEDLNSGNSQEKVLLMLKPILESEVGKGNVKIL